MMDEKGVSVYYIREKAGRKTVRRLWANENTEARTLNRLCVALHCRIEDIVEYVEDEPV